MGHIHCHRNLLKLNFKHNAIALESGREEVWRVVVVSNVSFWEALYNPSSFPIVYQYTFFCGKGQYNPSGFVNSISSYPYSPKVTAGVLSLPLPPLAIVLE